jgi:hypothetical protein
MAHQIGWRARLLMGGDDPILHAGSGDELGRVIGRQDVRGFAKGLGEFGEERSTAEAVHVETRDDRRIGGKMRRESGDDVGLAAAGKEREDEDESVTSLHVLMIALA